MPSHVRWTGVKWPAAPGPEDFGTRLRCEDTGSAPRTNCASGLQPTRDLFRLP
jgi:hypothetical protein